MERPQIVTRRKIIVSSLRRKIKRTGEKIFDPPYNYYETGNRRLRRAIKNRRVANPDNVQDICETTYIKARLRG